MSFPKPSQNCSVGLRSGDLDFQFIWRIFSSSVKSSTISGLYGFALSTKTWNLGLKHRKATSHKIHGPHHFSIMSGQYLGRRRVVVYEWEHYAATDNNFSVTKSVDLFCIVQMIASSTFSPDEDSTRITLHVES